jgi:hypothetical protein
MNCNEHPALSVSHQTPVVLPEDLVAINSGGITKSLDGSVELIRS